MKENIETKDVQRTEYLDKNGLDMLWAKVKENTHNQVEVERNRATTQENRIIETKADKSELHSSYVSNSTFTALQQKVAANTDAISNKQDAGNYLHYKTLNNEGYYEIPDIRIPDSGGNNKIDIDSQSISVNCSYPDSHTTITCDGISNTDNNANHVYATDGSIADLTQYALSSTIAALQQKITDNTTAISAKQDAGNYIPYNKASDSFYYLYNIGIISQIGDDSNKTILHPAFFEQSDGNHSVTIRDGYINISNTRGNIMTLNNDDEDGGIVIYKHLSNSIEESLRILEDGIRLIGGDNNHVLTSNASTIDITQYAKKSELPTVPTKVSQLQNDSNFAYKEKVDTLVNNLQIDVNRLSTDKQDKIIPGNLNISALNSQYTIVVLKNTIMDLISVLEKSGVITVTRS